MTERQALFVSHATPEDNPFTIWLGAQLAAAGYEVQAVSPVFRASPVQTSAALRPFRPA